MPPYNSLEENVPLLRPNQQPVSRVKCLASLLLRASLPPLASWGRLDLHQQL